MRKNNYFGSKFDYSIIKKQIPLFAGKMNEIELSAWFEKIYEINAILKHCQGVKLEEKFEFLTKVIDDILKFEVEWKDRLNFFSITTDCFPEEYIEFQKSSARNIICQLVEVVSGLFANATVKKKMEWGETIRDYLIDITTRLGIELDFLTDWEDPNLGEEDPDFPKKNVIDRKVETLPSRKRKAKTPPKLENIEKDPDNKVYYCKNLAIQLGISPETMRLYYERGIAITKEQADNWKKEGYSIESNSLSVRKIRPYRAYLKILKQGSRVLTQKKWLIDFLKVTEIK